MVGNRKTLREVPFFVVLFSMYPGLALLSTNIQEVDGTAVARPVLISVISTGLLIGILYGLLRSWTKAVLGATVALALFFSYGHVVRYLIELTAPRYLKSVQITLYIISFAIILFTMYWIRNSRQNFTKWIASLNITSVVLVMFPLFHILIAHLELMPDAKLAAPLYTEANADEALPASPINTVTPNQYPDIYYIILDAYSRADTLEAMGYDNSQFLHSLTKMGFYVASCSRSNYRSTLLSMPSILNMEYLPNILPDTSTGDSTIAFLSDVLIHNHVRSELEKLGYTIISFQTGYQWNEWEDADIYLSPKSHAIIQLLGSSSLSPFEYIFLSNTALFPLIENSEFATTRFNDHIRQVKFTLDELPEIAKLPGPKFVYAHIMTPHYPFVFLPDGSLNTDSRYYNTERGTPSDPDLTKIGYINNIQFLNSRIPDVVQSIIQVSPSPLLIIIQGDHGHVIPERRFNNLNAFYLPNGGNKFLYPTITSVNTFRVVFNVYFGTKFELLEDVSIDASVGTPYDKTIIEPFPESCP